MPKKFNSPRKDNLAHRAEHECPEPAPGSETHHGMPKPDPSPAPPQAEHPVTKEPEKERAEYWRKRGEREIKHVRVNTAQQGSAVKGKNWWQIGFNAVAGIGLAALGLPHLIPAVTSITQAPEKPPQATISRPVQPSPVTVEVLRLQGQVADLQGQIDTVHDRMQRKTYPDIAKLAKRVKRHGRWISKHDNTEEKLLNMMAARVRQLERATDERERRLANYQR